MPSPWRELAARAQEAEGGDREDRMSDNEWQQIEVEAIQPRWHSAGKVHDWRNHISEPIRAIWDTFTEAQRIALAKDAGERADAEQWE